MKKISNSSFMSIFSHKNKRKKIKDNSKESKSKAFLAKLSGSFLIPVAVLSIAGLFIGISSAFSSVPNASNAIKILGSFFSSLGWPVYNALPLLFLVAIIIGFTDGNGIAIFAGAIGYLTFSSIQSPFISTSSIIENGIKFDTAEILGIHTSTDISKKMFGIVSTNLGISSLNTSIFGGIVVGFVSIYVYNKFHDIKLPQMFSFYGGKRFISIAMILVMIPVAFLFLLIWPWIGLGFAYFGEYSGKVAGLDSFISNFIERVTIPFGLHYILSLAINYSSAGGDIASQFNNWNGTIVAANGEVISNADFIHQIIYNDKDELISYMGDRGGWLAVAGSPFNDVTFKYGNGQEQTLKIFEFFDKEVGINLGRFQLVNPIKNFPLPAAALAMVMAAPKERRKEAMSICLPAAFTAFFVGVTEPLEFTFLFLAPVLYWGFHSVMTGLVGVFANLAGVHVGSFQGIMDDITFAIIPVAKGTNFWWIYIIGLAVSPIYFGVFYWWIKHYNLATPGRGLSTGFITKKVYKELKSKSKKTKIETLSEQGKKIVSALGGWDNITKYSNCTSRLRYDIKDKKMVNEAVLKTAGGVLGVMWNGDNHIQIVVGTTSDWLNSNIKKHIGSNL